MTSARRSAPTLGSRALIDLSRRDEVHSVEADALEAEIVDFLHELDLENCGTFDCLQCKPEPQKMMN